MASFKDGAVTKNKTAGSGVYHPGPSINKSARKHAAGKIPEPGTMMGYNEYDKLLLTSIKKDSPNRSRR